MRNINLFLFLVGFRAVSGARPVQYYKPNDGPNMKSTIDKSQLRND